MTVLDAINWLKMDSQNRRIFHSKSGSNARHHGTIYKVRNIARSLLSALHGGSRFFVGNLSDIILSSVSIAKPHEHYLQLFNTCQNDCFSSDKHNYRTFFVDSTFAQFMNSRIQKLINSLTRGHTSKTEGGDPTIWNEPVAEGDPDTEIVAAPRATAQHAPNS